MDGFDFDDEPVVHDPYVPLKPIKFAIVSWGLGMGGAERHCLSLARYGPAVGCYCTGIAVIHPYMHEALGHEAADLTSVHVTSGFPHSSASRRFTYHRTLEDAVLGAARGADIVVTWGAPSIVAKITAATGLPTIFVEHGASDQTPPVAWPSGVGVVAVGERAAAAHRRSFNEDATVILNGVESRRLTTTLRRDEARARYGFHDDEIVIGYFGRAANEKNFTAAVQALVCLPEEYVAFYRTDVDTTFAGDALTRYININALNNRVLRRSPSLFLGDSFQALDVFVLSSFTEANSLAMLEAFYCGVPVAATAVGAVAELSAAHGDLVAIIYDPYEPFAIADAVLRALRMSQERIVEIKKLAARYWTAERMAAAWRDYFIRFLRMRHGYQGN